MGFLHQVLDPRTAVTSCLLELQDNEAAFSVCTVNFHDKDHGTLLAVGTTKGLQCCPNRSLVAGFIHIYKFLDEGKGLELLQKTQVEGVPLALCQFQGRLLAGIGPVLCSDCMTWGKRGCSKNVKINCSLTPSSRFIPIMIGSMLGIFKSRFISASIDGMRISCTYLPMIVLQDGLNHHTMYDFDTMAAADKFGNIYFVRLPQDVSDEIEEDPARGKIKWEQGKLNGSPNKVVEIVQFHVGDVVTSLQKAFLILGGGECIIYGTVMADGELRSTSSFYFPK